MSHDTYAANMHGPDCANNCAANIHGDNEIRGFMIIIS